MRAGAGGDSSVSLTLADRLQEDLYRALRAGDPLRVSTIRLARAAMHNAAIELGRPLTEAEIQQIMGREIKRRREAIEAFTKGGREDLVRKESLELAILAEYLPPPLSEVELRTIIADAVAQLAARGPHDIGRVMGAVMPKVKDRVDGRLVNQLVREALGTG